MSDKIVQTTSSLITANAVIPTIRPVNVSTPNVTTRVNLPDTISTNIDTVKIVGIVTNMGEEVLTNPELFKRAQDYYRISDQIELKMTFNVVRSDLFHSSDVVTKQVSYIRPFQELKTTNDSYKVFNISKNILDQVIVPELFQVNLSKSVFDITYNTDKVSKSILKNTIDTFTNTDVYYKHINKASLEQVNSSDLFTRVVGFNRILVDTIGATDDFYGAANIDDDQIAYVGKVFQDSVTNTDLNSKIVYSSKQDTSNTVEQYSVKTTKPLFSSFSSLEQVELLSNKLAEDSSSLSDVIHSFITKYLNTYTDSVLDTQIFSIQKQLLDIAASNDTPSAKVSKELLDSLISLDSVYTTWLAYREFQSITNSTQLINFTTSKELVEGIVLQELHTYSVSKYLQESVGMLDQISTLTVYNRSFNDLVNFTDDFFGNANIDDDQIAYVGKNLIDILYTAEQVSNSVSKVLNTNLYSSDLLSTRTNKIAYDNLNSLDSVYLAPFKNINSATSNIDTTSISTLKSVAEHVSSSDLISFFRFTGPFFTEIIATNDSGVINNQSYFAESYAEPGYVGTNTYFS